MNYGFILFIKNDPVGIFGKKQDNFFEFLVVFLDKWSLKNCDIYFSIFRCTDFRQFQGYETPQWNSPNLVLIRKLLWKLLNGEDQNSQSNAVSQLS